jgi:UDP-sugar pyrophosphorylase
MAEFSDFETSLLVLTPSQRELVKKLNDADQSHLFEGFTTSSSPAVRRQLAKQLESLDEAYRDGGLLGYISNAKTLLESSRQGVNPLEGWVPSVPQGETFELGTKEYAETEALGMEQLGSVGFVLVAGGLGERLGYGSIKVRYILDLDDFMRAIGA